jgi:hypothetical protein
MARATRVDAIPSLMVTEGKNSLRSIRRRRDLLVFQRTSIPAMRRAQGGLVTRTDFFSTLLAYRGTEEKSGNRPRENVPMLPAHSSLLEGNMSPNENRQNGIPKSR